MANQEAPRRGVVPNWSFDDCVLIAPKSKKETVVQILKQHHAYALLDPAAFHSANGGTITEPWTVEIPDGTLFRILAYTKDLEFWRTSIIRFCTTQDRRWAEIRGSAVVLDDGHVVPLNDCAFHDQ